MITIKKLEWDNWFSYGESNSIDFTAESITQLLGANGVGKSSIPLILEEVIYGKNSKGTKKQDLPNRHIDKCSTKATVFFQIDEDDYELNIIRKSSITLVLKKNSIDVSSHKSADTYKYIEKVIGLDFKTFCQLIYQSSTSSLQFLTATDANRKKFLINLLSLDQYTDMHNSYKTLVKDNTAKVNKLEGSIQAISDWVTSNSIVQKIKDQIDVPESPVSLLEQVSEYKSDLKNVTKTNKEIKDNNIKLLNEKSLQAKLSAITKPTEIPVDISGNKLEKDEAVFTLKSNNSLIKKIQALGNECHTCYQEIPSSLKVDTLAKLSKDNVALSTIIDTQNVIIDKANKYRIKYGNYNKLEKDLADTSKYIDKTLSTQLVDIATTTQTITALENSIRDINASIVEANASNIEVERHNAKVELIATKLLESSTVLAESKESLKLAGKLAVNLSILKDTFSTKGIVSYKIESMIKELEDEINSYLVELSAGRFQLIFRLVDDKLNIVIIDDGHEVGITALSAGELARVNVATLLAIRKLMSALSATKINLLFLDETYSVLDIEGKDTLTNILLKEDLNTFLVAHDYTHPLMAKLEIVKENNISRII